MKHIQKTLFLLILLCPLTLLKGMQQAPDTVLESYLHIREKEWKTPVNLRRSLIQAYDLLVEEGWASGPLYGPNPNHYEIYWALLIKNLKDGGICDRQGFINSFKAMIIKLDESIEKKQIGQLKKLVNTVPIVKYDRDSGHS